MRTMLRAALVLMVASLSAFAQSPTKINPASQVNWPTLTGSGAPAASCTSANYGQPYTDTAANPNVSYTCGSHGWQQSGGGGSYPGVASDGNNGLAITGAASAGGGFAFPDGSKQLYAVKGINPQAAPYYASGFVAQTTTTASVSAGSLTIPVASSTGFYVGDVAVVALAGASDGNSGTSNFACFVASTTSTSITCSGTAVTGASLPPNTTSSASGTQSVPPLTPVTVWSFASTTTTASTASGATSITVANAATYSTGQGILISTGGASGANLIATITGVSGSVISFTPAISNASGVASGVNVQHDDTNAIQGAVYQATVNQGTPVSGYTPNSQGATIILPDGVYQLNGPLQDTSGANSIITMPKVLYYGTSTYYWTPLVDIEFRGVSLPQFNQGYLAHQNVTGWNGAVLYTAQNSGSLFSGYDSSSYLQNITNVRLRFNSVSIRVPGNPSINAVNGQTIAIVQGEHINIDTTATNGNIPTASETGTGTAWIMPRAQNAGQSLLFDFAIATWPLGSTAEEHSEIFLGRYDGDLTAVKIGVNSASGYSTQIQNVQMNGCAHGVVGQNTMSIQITGLNVEHFGGFQTADDFSDASNNLNGTVESDVSLIVIGAANVTFSTRNQSGNNYRTSAGLFVFGRPSDTYSQRLGGDSGQQANTLAKFSYSTRQVSSAQPADTLSTLAGTTGLMNGAVLNYICTAACNVDVNLPITSPYGARRTILNDDNTAAVITVAPPANVQLETTARTGYCTAGQALVSGGTATDRLTLLARDATHWVTETATGTWTCTTITPFDPQTVFGSTLVSWFRGDQTSCNNVSGCAISQLFDIAGAHNAVFASTSGGNNAVYGAQGTYAASSLNGQPSISLTSGQTAYELASPPTLGNISGFAVLQVSSLSSNQAILSSASSGGPEWRIDSSTGKQDFLSAGSASIGTSSSGITAGAYVKIGFTYNSSTGVLNFYQGSDTILSTTTNVHAINSQPLAELFAELATGSNIFKGNLVDLVIVNGVATSTQITQIMGSTGYFHTLYGL